VALFVQFFFGGGGRNRKVKTFLTIDIRISFRGYSNEWRSFK